MTQYMLDTNTVSFLIKGHSLASERLAATPTTSVFISAITKGEIYYGLAKRPDAKQLHYVVGEFLKRVDVLPWEDSIAERYGITCARLESKGKTLSPLDLLIAAHALEKKAVLVTNDHAFSYVTGLQIEDWTTR